MTPSLPMAIRSIDEQARTIEGVCVPYDETSYLTPHSGGERVLRGAFRKSLAERQDRVFLFRNHDHGRAVGRSQAFADDDLGLRGTFHLRPSLLGDDVMEEVRDGYLPALSVGFRPVRQQRAADGVTEVAEASLLEVSLVTIGAYEGARVVAVRHALEQGHLQLVDVDLSPVPPVWLYGS